MEDFSIICLLVFILCITCICNYSNTNTEGYELTSETIIIDKFITYRQSDAKPFYYLVFKDDEGTIRQELVNPDVYYRFEIDNIKE